jgi:phage recombination protein Bet
VANEQTETLPAIRSHGAVGRHAPAELNLTEEHRTILKRGICKDLDDTEFEVFLMRCKLQGAHPFSGLLFPVVYNKTTPAKRTMVIQTGLDFKRARANSSREYEGVAFRRLFVQIKDGTKITVDHEQYDPAEHVKIISATVGVWRKGFREPEKRTALFDKFNKRENLWLTIPDHMILKVAESHALSAAFPELLQGIYIPEEMEWANPPIDVTPGRVKLEQTDGREPWGFKEIEAGAGNTEQSGTGEQAQGEIEGQKEKVTAVLKDTVAPYLRDRFSELADEERIKKVWGVLRGHFGVSTLYDLTDEQIEQIMQVVRSAEFEQLLRGAKILSSGAPIEPAQGNLLNQPPQVSDSDRQSLIDSLVKCLVKKGVKQKARQDEAIASMCESVGATDVPGIKSLDQYNAAVDWIAETWG